MSKIYKYFAVVEYDDNPGWSAYYPDIPGTATGGEEDAPVVERLQELLALALYGLLEDGDKFPNPSEPENIGIGHNEQIVAVEIDFDEWKRRIEKERMADCSSQELKTLAEQYGLNTDRIIHDALSRAVEQYEREKAEQSFV